MEDNTLHFEIKQPKQYTWNPKEDITAYELALCIPVLSYRGIDVGDFIEALPDNARRHFKEVKQ